MNKRQIADANECEQLAEQGIDKDCLGCSCSVCIAQEPKEFTPNDYQKAALRTANSLKSEDLVLNGILGLCGETGEVSDHIKKHLFQGHELDVDKVINELGDVCWYIAILAKGLNIDLKTVMKRNIDKLMKRYPDGFKVSNSVHRKDDE
jgi:NTP pyrophosphatase (non-canonical NTP hydrolase)